MAITAMDQAMKALKIVAGIVSSFSFSPNPF